MRSTLISPSERHLPAALLMAPLLALAACGGGSSQPKATDPPDIGSYEDPFDFQSFGEDLDEAVEGRDQDTDRPPDHQPRRPLIRR